ncbi:MAG: murein DD-endopeptidase MepM/ murein hydrolase activator NlpD [Saprospiraceae bacterium]|jgi:murein DD-endopeptidase MepM/ murein hydrolase activator NlpD
MSREKYVYNPQTLQYEQEKVSGKNKVKSVLGYVSAVTFTALILSSSAYLFLPTPKEKSLERDIVQMEYYYQNLSQEFDKLNESIDKIQNKDAEVHRVVFGMDPIDESVWNGGTGGSQEVVRLHSNLDADLLLSTTIEKVEKLKRKIEIQNNSLSQLAKVALEHEDRIASIPSIKPIHEDKLKRKVRHMSGYGMRIHPVHKVRRMHHGIDFTAPAGTAIQATGNGVIVKIASLKTGYGKSILIDHGYGYNTLYGHLKSTNVKLGQRVKKGELIGLVGSTGTSTAPHCHYEIRKDGIAVNPIDYCLDGLSPEEYHDLVGRAQEENQSFD